MNETLLLAALRRIVPAIALAALAAGPASAAPVTYTLDPLHTYPSVEVEHLGISWLRGKFNHSSGKVVLDREAGTGSVDVRVDPASIDFGHEGFDKELQGEHFLDVARYPEIRFTADSIRFANGVPVEIPGTMTLLGHQGPLVLHIDSFRCRPHPLHKREVCGVDATGEFDRRAFGWTYLSDAHGGRVRLRIQAEGLRTD